jgi:hypothetical protein
MGRFTKLRKNKKYNYSPRYYDDKGEGSPFKIERKLDRFRSTAEPSRGLKSKLSSAMADRHRAGDKNHNTRLVVILALLILVVLYIFDFDLSIFYAN